MKKRVLSLLMALALCLSMQPTTTFAENAGTVTEQEELSTTGDTVSGNDVSGGDTGDANADVQDAQALINALPDEVTAENADEVETLLGAIDEAMAKLTDEQAAGLDMTRWENICNAMNASALVAVQDDGVHTDHFICGADCKHGDESHKLPTGAWTPIENESQLVWNMKAGNYYLADDLVLTKQWSISSNSIVLCLNGHSIKMNTNDTAISVGSAGTFTLCDCKGNGTITHGKQADGTTAYTGTGVAVSSGGKFNMYGGTITGNTLGDYGEGGGVHVEYAGTFNMYGGTVTENSAPSGGGVSVERNGTFNMYGGTISNNTAGVYGGGGVYVYINGKFTMSNGSISNNMTDSGYGGGVYVYDDYSGSGTFTMTGGIINNNTSSQGGGVYLEKVSEGSGSTFIMEGGLITGNTTTKAGSQVGGGVYVVEGSNFTVSGDVQIKENKNNAGETNNVYLPTTYDKPVTITVANKLDSNASIGVTMCTTPREGKPLTFATAGEGCVLSDDDAARFTSDQGCYPYRMDDENEVKMFVYMPQKHPICGEVCTHNGEHTDLIWIGISQLRNIEGDGNYYLVYDTATGALEGLPSYNINLCLNGKTITNMVSFGKGDKKLSYALCDCQETPGKITGSTKSDGGIWLGYGATLDMYGGKITGNNTVGVYVDNGTFNMHGGEITDNHYTGIDGGNTGSITSIYGEGAGAGGVRVDENGMFNMSGNAKVSNNTATFNSNVSTSGNYGAAGVYVNGGTFTMTENAEVSGNKLTTEGINESNNNYAGGVYVRNAESSNVTVGGNVKITGNTKNIASSGISSNVCLPKGQTIKVDKALTAGSNSIGVITETPIVEGDEAVIAEGKDYTLTEDDKNAFSSDDSIPAVLEGGKIILQNGVHSHSICNETNCSDGHVAKKWKAISALSEINGSGSYFLKNDVSLEKTWKCQYADVELCLNGKTITCRYGLDLITVASNASLTITDCQTTLGKITHEDGATGACGIMVEGSLTLWNGSITKNTHTQKGGVHVAAAGTFTMNGGFITENATDGGVHVAAGGTFNMHGGFITKNDDSHGGVYVKGTFNMDGGDIAQNRYNVPDEACGGGVYVEGGVFNMDDGNITENEGAYGGGVFVGMSGTFTMKGGEITQNKYTHANGGGSGVYVSNSSTFNMHGGEITGNTNSTANGVGGVYVSYGSTFNMTNGKITGNTNNAANGGGGVHVVGTFAMDGGKITGNTNSAEDGGGGVYVSQFGTFTMNGGTITGNNTSATDDSSAGGVLMNGTFNLSGAAKIIDNWKGGTQAGSVYVKDAGTASNVYLHNEWPRLITIGEGLTQAAQIGVSIGGLPTTAGGEVQIANGATNDQLEYTKIFTLDLEPADPYYSVIRNEYNNLFIRKHKHDWSYSASGATITVNCTAENCPIKDGKGGSITIVAPENLIYDRNAKSATLDKKLSTEFDGVITTTISYTAESGETFDSGHPPVDAGTYTASIDLEDRGVHLSFDSPAAVKYTIQKAELTADDFYFNIDDPKCDLVYSGADKELTEDNFGCKYFNTGDITVRYLDANGAEVAPRNVGTYTFAIDVTESKNYEVAPNLTAHGWTFTITKAKGGDLGEGKFQRKYIDRTEKIYTPAYGLPDGEKWTYSISAPTVTGSAAVGAYTIDSATGAITYKLTDGGIGDTVSWEVTISSDNYEKFTKKLTLTLTDKDSQDPLSITGGNTVVYGETLKLGTNGGSGTGAVTYSIGAGSTGEATIDADGVLTPVRVGSVFVKATKAGDDNYFAISSELVEVTITQAVTTGEPKYTKITTDGKTLADAGLTPDGSTLSPVAGTLEWVDEEGKALSGDTEVKVNTTYKWRFTPEGGNYKTLTGEVELYHVDAPAISAQPVNASVKAEERAVFEVTATGTDLTYQWKINRNDGKGFVNITGADSASYTSGITDTDCNGFQYYCVISNAAGSVTTDTVTLTVTVQYDILAGADSSWTENTDGSLAIRGSGAIDKFLRVLVDGNEIASDNYTVTEGSTIITLKLEYLKTLSEGSHSFEIVWTDGTARTSFTIAKNTSGNNGGNNNGNNNNNNSNNDSNNNNAGSGANTTDTTIKAPQTGDTSKDALWIVLLVVASIAGLSGFAEILVRRKKSDCK